MTDEYTMMTPAEADAILPLGTIMPFKPGCVPANWVQWQGQTLSYAEYPTLIDSLNQALAGVAEMNHLWGSIGGALTPDSVTLPNVDTYEKANFFLYGDAYQSLAPQPMVIAIKARRTDAE